MFDELLRNSVKFNLLLPTKKVKFVSGGKSVLDFLFAIFLLFSTPH